MKVYKANVTVTAVFYDGSIKGEIEVINFCQTARGVDRVVRTSPRSNKQGLFIRVFSEYNTVWIPLPDNSYIVRYPNGLIYPYKKSTFEKRFKEVK